MLMYPRLYLQVGSPNGLTYLLRYCSPNLCKWNYLFGKLPLYKIEINHFMASDELSGATILNSKTFFSFH